MKKLLRVYRDMDKTILFTTLILTVFGTLNIVTASSREAVLNTNSGMFYYFYKHILILILCLIEFIVLLLMPTKKYNKYIPLLYLLVLGANVFLVMNGVAINGATGWINFGRINLQPSEFAKPVVIITMAILLSNYDKLFRIPGAKRSKEVGIVIFMILVFPIFVFLQRDIGTASILFGIFFVLFIFCPLSLKEKAETFALFGGVVAMVLLVVISINNSVLNKAQASRFDFYNPCSKYEKNGYQVCNAFIAINNGGALGVGIGNSTQKYSYIPEPHTDMVFSIIAEENGVLKCSLIFLAYIVLLYRILKISMNTKNIKNKYICLGVATYIFLHVFINLGGLFGVIPLTGVPLPFLSYGGSFMISLVATIAVVERIHIEMKNEKIRV